MPLKQNITITNINNVDQLYKAAEYLGFKHLGPKETHTYNIPYPCYICASPEQALSITRMKYFRGYSVGGHKIIDIKDITSYSFMSRHNANLTS